MVHVECDSIFYLEIEDLDNHDIDESNLRLHFIYIRILHIKKNGSIQTPQIHRMQVKIYNLCTELKSMWTLPSTMRRILT